MRAHEPDARSVRTCVLTVADGRAHLVLDPERVDRDRHGDHRRSATRTRSAMARGELDPADALAAGRVRVRGDLAALVARPGRAGRGGGAARDGGLTDPSTRLTDDPAADRRRGPHPLLPLGAPACLRRALHAARSRSSPVLRPASAHSSAATWPGPARWWSGLGPQHRAPRRPGGTSCGGTRPRSATITCDVADTAPCGAPSTQVAATLGPIDLLVNNAAQDPGVRLVDIGEEDFRRHLRRQLLRPGGGHARRHAAMVERGHGTIINVSSDGGRLPSPGPGAYPSSKAALSAFTESTSFRLAPKGVQVHVVYPAFMATELGLGALGRGLRRPPRLTMRSVRDGVAPDPGAGRWPFARDQRLGPDRRRHGVPHRDAPDLPPAPPQLVGPGRAGSARVLADRPRCPLRSVGSLDGPSEQRVTEVSFRVPARRGRAAVGGTTCISRSTTTSF